MCNPGDYLLTVSPTCLSRHRCSLTHNFDRDWQYSFCIPEKTQSDGSFTKHTQVNLIRYSSQTLYFISVPLLFQLLSTRHADSQVRVRWTPVRTEASARWTRLDPHRLSAPVRRASPADCVSRVSRRSVCSVLQRYLQDLLSLHANRLWVYKQNTRSSVHSLVVTHCLYLWKFLHTASLNRTVWLLWIMKNAHGGVICIKM